MGTRFGSGPDIGEESFRSGPEKGAANFRGGPDIGEQASEENNKKDNLFGFTAYPLTEHFPCYIISFF